MIDEGPARLVAWHIERGLDRYGRGELVAAIVEWEAALRLDPANLRARQYIQYVRENFEQLALEFGRVVASPEPAEPARLRPATGPAPPAEAANGNWQRENQSETLAALASGWDLEDFVPEALPPPPTAPPVPTGFDLGGPPEAEWAPQDTQADDLAQIAQSVVEPFGMEMTPPQGVDAVEPSSGSMDALGGRPLGPDPLAGLEPGFDLERTHPSLVRRRGARGPLVEDEAQTGERAAGPFGVDEEFDFSSVFEEPVPPPRPPSFGSRPATPAPRSVPLDRAPPPTSSASLDPDEPLAEIVVEMDAELPDEYPTLPTTSGEFEVDLGSMQAAGAPLPPFDPELLPDEALPGLEAFGRGPEPEEIHRGDAESGDLVPAPRAETDPDADATMPDEPPTLTRRSSGQITAIPSGHEPRVAPDSYVEMDLFIGDPGGTTPEPAEGGPPPRDPPVVTLPPPLSFLGAKAAGSLEQALVGLTDAPSGLSDRPIGSSLFEAEATPLPAPYDPQTLLDDYDEARAIAAANAAARAGENITPVGGNAATDSTEPADPVALASETAAPGTGAPTAALPRSHAASALAQVYAHLAEARQHFEDGDLEPAAAAANQAFDCDPNGEGALARAAERQLLLRIFEGQLGSLRRVPRLALAAGRVAELGLDHRAGFLLDRMDGQITFDDLLDIAGMPRLEAFHLLVTLLRKGVIRTRD